MPGTPSSGRLVCSGAAHPYIELLRRARFNWPQATGEQGEACSKVIASSRHTRSRYPIFQSPMTWIARSPLVSAVSAAGGMGLLENSIADLSVTTREFAAIRAATNQPFGVNLPVRYLQANPEMEKKIIDWLLGQGIHFVTTSAGDPTPLCEASEGRGRDRLSRHRHPARRAEGGRRRRRRADRRGRGERGPAQPGRGAFVRAAAGGARGGGRADRRRRRHRRRPRHGGGLRARRRGRHHGHALRRLARKPGAPELQATRSSMRRSPARC